MANQVEQQYFQFGLLVSPLTSATTNPLLLDADPALSAVIGFYQAVLQIHLGARFDAEMTKAGLLQFVGKCSTLAIPYDPLPFLTQAQLVPPFIAVFPTTEERDEHTRNWVGTVATWKALWVLPPMSPAQYLALYPFLRAAGQVLMNRTELGYDPSYQSGAQVCVTGGISKFVVSKLSYGSIPQLNSQLFFPTVEATLCVEQITVPCASPPATRDNFTGTDVTIETTDPTGTETFMAQSETF